MTPVFAEDPFAPSDPDDSNRPYSADDELIDDPEALEAAQAAANAEEPYAAYEVVGEDWVAVWGPELLGRTDLEVAQNAAMLTMPLDAEGIAFAWQPYPPASGYTQRGFARPFTVIVAPADAARARELLAQPGERSAGAATPAPAEAQRPSGFAPPRAADADLEGQQGRGLAVAIALLLVLATCAALVYFYATGHYHGLARIFGP